jgi:hypothetical protein
MLVYLYIILNFCNLVLLCAGIVIFNLITFARGGLITFADFAEYLTGNVKNV